MTEPSLPRGKPIPLPAWILWLSPVIVAPLLAVFWMSWAARPRGPVEAMQTVEQYDRFRAALTQPAPEPRRARRPDRRERVRSR